MKSFYRLFFIWLLTFLLAFLWINNSLAQEPKIIKLVAEGDPSPGGGVLGRIGAFSFNDNEDLAFNSATGNFTSALFLSSGDDLTTVINDTLPVEGFGTFTRLGVTSINNQGTIAFGAQLVNDQSAKNGLFLRTAEGVISPVVFHGDPIEGGTLETPTLRPFALNNSGAVAFEAYITPEPFRQAIFIGNGSTVSKVAATGEATPIGGTFKFAFFYLLDFNDAGTVLFESDIEGSSSRDAIFTAKDGVISKIVAQGDVSPDGKEFTYLDFSASMNNLGDIVFEGSVGEDFGVDYSGIFLYSNGVISLVAKAGDAAPGGGQYSSFSFPLINDSKQIVFQSSIDGGTSSSGIFTVSTEGIAKIVLSEETTPVGGSYSAFNTQSLNQGGSVAFSSYSYVDGGSATTAIFLWNGGPRIEISRDTVEFTDIIPGQTAKLELEVSNSGGKPLEVQEITASPSPPFGVENTPSLPFSIEPGQKTQFLVTYSSPSNNSTNPEKISEALQDGSLTIKTNAPNAQTVIPILTPPTLGMLPDGVAYDPLNPYLEGGGAFHSKFTDLKITGTNLELVNQVTFSSPDHIEVTRINATATQIDFDIIVYHDAVLGERDLILRTSDNKEIKVTQTIGRKFIITKVNTQFNQAVDQAAVNTPEYRDKLVANKQGVIRVQFQDPNQYNQIFNGRVEVIGLGTPGINPFIHVPQASYSEDDIINGRDYLSMPMPQPLTAGIKTFKFILNRVTDGRIIFGPIINRRIIESVGFNIVGISFRIRKPDGTILNPVTDTDARSGLDLLKLVYPISGNKLTYTHLGTRNLPSTLSSQLKDVTNFDGKTITILPGNSRSVLSLLMGKLLSDLNSQRAAKGQPIANMLVGIFPQYVFYEDTNNDGKADESTLGSTSTFLNVSVQAVDNTEIQQVLAHEIGHAFQGSLSLLNQLNEQYGFGDEYFGGAFNCEKNPPIKEIKGVDGNSCVNSPYSLLVNGDLFGTYTDASAFDPVRMRPMLTYIGASQNSIKYNFMGSNNGQDSSWVQPSVYNELLKSFIPLSGAEQNLLSINNSIAGNGIRLTGTIYKNDQVSFEDFVLVTSNERSPQSGGVYSFELQNSSGSVLASNSFDMDFVELSEPPRISNHDLFNIVMDFPDGTKKIVLKKNGLEIASRTVSDNAPAVQILQPDISDPGGDIQLQWTASDPDNDSLTYTILYSPDNELWLPVETDIKETNYTWNSSQFPGGNSAQIAIMVSDGVNTGKAELTLSSGIAKKPPTVVFTNPEIDTTYDGLSPVIFSASGYDPEDGTLDPASYTFTSSIDGQLGTGSPFFVNKLSAGQHIIYVSVQDSDGNIATDSVSIIAQIPVSVKGKTTSLVPDEYKLYQNYPNPFNPSTNIQFDLPKQSHVTIKIYDIQGQEIITLVDRMYSAGQHTVVWNGNSNRAGTLSSGVYFIQMHTEDFMIVKKAVLIR